MNQEQLDDRKRQIAIIEAILDVKHLLNEWELSFFHSILQQLKNYKILSAKQVAIIDKTIYKYDLESEGDKGEQVAIDQDRQEQKLDKSRSTYFDDDDIPF